MEPQVAVSIHHPDVAPGAVQPDPLVVRPVANDEIALVAGTAEKQVGELAVEVEPQVAVSILHPDVALAAEQPYALVVLAVANEDVREISHGILFPSPSHRVITLRWAPGKRFPCMSGSAGSWELRRQHVHPLTAGMAPEVPGT